MFEETTWHRGHTIKISSVRYIIPLHKLFSHFKTEISSNMHLHATPAAGESTLPVTHVD